MPSFSIEEIIRRAIEEGEFDDLPGKGKPLAIADNPHQDPDWRAAHHILQSGGFSLPWIEVLREIDNNLQQARERLANTWAWYLNQQDDQILKEFLERDWLRAKEQFRVEIRLINDQIRDYNLEVPNIKFQLPIVNADQEIEKAIQRPK